MQFNRDIAIMALKDNIEGFLGLKCDRRYNEFLFEYDKDFPLRVLSHLPNNTGYLAHYNQLDPRINLNKVNVIHLIRRNVLERAISAYILKYKLRGKIGALTRLNQSKFNFNRKFKVGKYEIKRTIKDTVKEILFWDAKLRKEGANYEVIYYEDIFDERSLTQRWEENEGPVKIPEMVARKLCLFLDVDYHEMYSNRKRVNTPNYQDYILNWKRIEKLKKMELCLDGTNEVGESAETL